METLTEKAEKMKYGIIGAFIKFAFAKTAFGYLEKEMPEIDLASYKKRVLSEYKAIVARPYRRVPDELVLLFQNRTRARTNAIST